MARGTSFPLLVVQLWKQTCVAVLSLILICLNAFCEASDPEVPERESIGLRLLFYAPLKLIGYDCAAMQDWTALFRIYGENAALIPGIN